MQPAFSLMRNHIERIERVQHPLRATQLNGNFLDDGLGRSITNFGGSDQIETRALLVAGD
jgi:hypothetical protein